MIANAILADVAELADALDLGSSTARCEGSSPFIRIMFEIKGFGDFYDLTHKLSKCLTYASKRTCCYGYYFSSPSSFRMD
jgi:hypothetical protein